MAPQVCASCGAKLEGGRRSADGRLVCGRCGRVVTSLSGNGSKLKPVRVGAPLAPPPRRAAGARSPSPTAAARAPVVAPAVGQSSRDAVVGDTRTESPKRGRTRGAAPSETSSTAVASPDPKRGDIVKAFIVLGEGSQPSDELGDEIKQFVRGHLSAFAYPREIEFVDDLPKTLTGKIRRIELRERQ